MTSWQTVAFLQLQQIKSTLIFIWSLVSDEFKSNICFVKALFPPSPEKSTSSLAAAAKHAAGETCESELKY